MFEHLIELENGDQVKVVINKSKCGRGVVICRQVLPKGRATPLDMHCSGSCGGGPTISWTCPTGQDCSLDCTGTNPVGSCY
jgi:hypothetical protein